MMRLNRLQRNRGYCSGFHAVLRRAQGDAYRYHCYGANIGRVPTVSKVCVLR